MTEQRQSAYLTEIQAKRRNQVDVTTESDYERAKNDLNSQTDGEYGEDTFYVFQGYPRKRREAVAECFRRDGFTANATFESGSGFGSFSIVPTINGYNNKEKTYVYSAVKVVIPQ